ncbi:MAG: AAA domain-containing protein [Bacteroidota bacterium]
MKLQNLIKYFNACYQADNSGLTINNFFGSSVESRIVFEEEDEIINGLLPFIPIETKKAVDASKTIGVYRKEKELVYASLFIIGKTISFTNKPTTICSPLFIYPAKIFLDDDIYYLEPDQSNRRVNYSLLSQIRKNEENNNEFFEEFSNSILQNNIDEFTLSSLIGILKKYLPELDTSSLNDFPKLMPQAAIRKMISSASSEMEGYKIIAASGAGIIKKSVNTRGIINELTTMTKGGNLSTPLKTIFNFQKTKKKSTKQIGRVPAIMNLSQQKVLEIAEKFPVSLINGPPGTGKSYTISALAIEQMSKGKSVLIASRTDQAVDVIADKIENQLGIKNVIIRGGRKEYLRELKQHLQNLLSGIRIPDEKNSSSSIAKKLNTLDNKIARLEKQFIKRVDDELDWGKYVAETQDDNGFFVSLRKKYINWRNNTTDTHWDIIQQLDKELKLEYTETVNYIEQTYNEQVFEALQESREDFKTLLKALRARQGSRQENLFEEIDFKLILKTFPIWLVKMSDIYKILPLQTELFDIAIIDEATQCDVASALPIIQRAKQVVFTGDPNQLRHVSFLSTVRQNSIAQKFNIENVDPFLIDYRNNSILDVITESLNNQEQVVFLNEHYRSTPAIIRFSNQKFYSNSLKIMSGRPDIPYNQGVEIIKCNGKRTNKGTNLEEADIILQKVHQIINNEVQLPKKACKSIGVLSPFRAQVEFLSEKIKHQFTLHQIERHRLNVATAYGFQGEERDVMFLSFVLDNESHPTAFRHINKRDVFNVSITRAKSLQYIVHSLNSNELNPTSILRQYLDSFITTGKEIKPNKVKDVFIDEVVVELQKLNLAIWVAYPIAGLKIDIIVQHKNKTFGIDLIGYPGEFEEAFTLERYKMLQRAGLNTFPLPYTYWVSDKEMCLTEILETLAIV